MKFNSPTTILNDIAAILRDFHGREYHDPIVRETLFFADLGLASIDAIVLAEMLESHYGQMLPFGEFMAELGRKTDRDIRIGELVDFLNIHLHAD